MGDERARLDGMGGRQTSNKIRKLIVRNGENQQLGTSCDVGSRKNFGIGNRFTARATEALETAEQALTT